MFRKLVLGLLCFSILSSNFVIAVRAQEYQAELSNQEQIRLDDLEYLSGRAFVKKAEYEEVYDPNTGEPYVRMSVSDFNEFRQAKISLTNIAKRLGDLEKALLALQKVVRFIDKAISFVTKILGIVVPDDSTEDTSSRYVDPDTGAVMDPGNVSFMINTTDPSKTFYDLGLTSLSMDILFNQDLFELDHIEGKGVIGNELTEVAISRQQRAFKTRIDMPLTDVQVSSVKFKVFLRPKKLSVKKGDKTKVKIEYFNRVPDNPNGSKGTPPLQFSAPLSNDQIEIVA